MKTKNYYIVQIKYPEGDWEIHFGDYDKQTARDEKQDVLNSNDQREPGDQVKARIIVKKVPFDQYLLDIS